MPWRISSAMSQRHEFVLLAGQEKRMSVNCADNLESVRPPPISGCADFRPKVFKVCKNFRVVLITRRRGPQRRSKKR